jgi:hypothetical protein
MSSRVNTFEHSAPAANLGVGLYQSRPTSDIAAPEAFFGPAARKNANHALAKRVVEKNEAFRDLLDDFSGLFEG